MQYKSAPVNTLFVKLVAQKRDDVVLAYTLLASDQRKIVAKNALFSRMYMSNFERSNLAAEAESVRQMLNFSNVVVV
jgi:hypothetical protein